MLLFVLIPLAWLGVSVLVVAICRIAARSDAMPVQALAPRQRLAQAGRRRRLRTDSRLAAHGGRVHSVS